MILVWFWTWKAIDNMHFVIKCQIFNNYCCFSEKQSPDQRPWRQTQNGGAGFGSGQHWGLISHFLFSFWMCDGDIAKDNLKKGATVLQDARIVILI